MMIYADDYTNKKILNIITIVPTTFAFSLLYLYINGLNISDLEGYNLNKACAFNWL